MYSTRPRKEKAKEERDIYGNTIDEEIELQGMSRERRAKHNREKLQQKLQAGSIAVWPFSAMSFPTLCKDCKLEDHAFSGAWFFLIYLLVAGNLSKALLPLLVFLLLDPALLASREWRRFCGDSEESLDARLAPPSPPPPPAKRRTAADVAAEVSFLAHRGGVARAPPPREEPPSLAAHALRVMARRAVG